MELRNVAQQRAISLKTREQFQIALKNVKNSNTSLERNIFLKAKRM